MKRAYRMLSLFVLLLSLVSLNSVQPVQAQPIVSGTDAAAHQQSEKIADKLSKDQTSSALIESSTNSVYLPLILNIDYGVCSTQPTLISPTNGSNLTTMSPLLQWDNGSNSYADTVILELAADTNFKLVDSTIWGGYIPGTSEFRLSQNLDAGRTYYWRAALSCGDVTGPYSEVWSFTTASDGIYPAAPTLVSPANGSTLPSLPATLKWSPVSGAIEYIVHWRRAGETDYYTYTMTSSPEIQFDQFFVDANTTYEWWVSARNDFAIGTDSIIWQFTTPAQTSSSARGNVKQGKFVVTDSKDNRYENLQ